MVTRSRMTRQRVVLGAAAVTALLAASSGAVATADPSPGPTGPTQTPTYSAFVVDGGPDYTGSLDQAPDSYRDAVLASAATGDPEVYDPSTGTYVLDSGDNGPPATSDLIRPTAAVRRNANQSHTAKRTTLRTGYTPADAADDSSDSGSVQPDDVVSGFYLPTGVLRSDYRYDQTAETRFGVIEHPAEDIVAEVFAKYSETISGGTSAYWHYGFTLDYKKGGLYRFKVRLTCAVNETGKPDDYCDSIKYPNGANDYNVTPSHVVEVHDLATGDTVQTNPSGFFGEHSTPPPSGSRQVVKFAHLTEEAYFSKYDVTATNGVRGWDVCVPKKKTFSGVTLCEASGTGR